MQKKYRPTRGARLFNRFVTTIVRLPVPAGPWALLTVPGRKSGLPRSTPVALLDDGDGWHLMAPYGPVDWVRNLRASGSATLTQRGRPIAVSARELPVADAAPLVRDTLVRANAIPVMRRLFAPYFDTPTDAPLSAWAKEARRHPVFRLTPAEDGASALPGARTGIAGSPAREE